MICDQVAMLLEGEDTQCDYANYWGPEAHEQPQCPVPTYSDAEKEAAVAMHGTSAPTAPPTEEPSDAASDATSDADTKAPTAAPTSGPTDVPQLTTGSPTGQPTPGPTSQAEGVEESQVDDTVDNGEEDMETCPSSPIDDIGDDIVPDGCGDCDDDYESPFGRESVGLDKCVEECRRRNCAGFSYGEKTSDGKPGLGCRIAKGSGACKNTMDRFCSPSYKVTWEATKSCCNDTRCGPINYWGGVMYERAAKSEDAEETMEDTVN